MCPAPLIAARPEPQSSRLAGRLRRHEFVEARGMARRRLHSVVGGDWTYRHFPGAESLERIMSSAPTVRFGFKAPECLTMHNWPNRRRYGRQARQDNEDFLDTGIYLGLFHNVIAPFDRTAVVIFEFGALPKTAFLTVREFHLKLGPFLASLPTGQRYAVEISLGSLRWTSPSYAPSRHPARASPRSWTNTNPTTKSSTRFHRRARHYERSFKTASDNDKPTSSSTADSKETRHSPSTTSYCHGKRRTPNSERGSNSLHPAG